MEAHSLDVLINNFSKCKQSKGGYKNRCLKCDNLLSQYKQLKEPISIIGRHCLLTDKPKVLKTCDCCGKEARTQLELEDRFRRIRNNTLKPSSHVLICKSCENVAALVLSELQFKAHEGLKLPRGSEEYYETLSTLFLVSGYTDVPMDADGHPVDLLSYQLTFHKENGQPFVPSAVRIRQIKIEGGYMSREETVWNKNS